MEIKVGLKFKSPKFDDYYCIIKEVSSYVKLEWVPYNNIITPHSLCTIVDIGAFLSIFEEDGCYLLSKLEEELL